jgi:hypothetical protein
MGFGACLRCRADAKSGLMHFRCKLRDRPAFKPLLVLTKPSVARQVHDGIATANPGSQIEPRFQQVDQQRF